VAEPIDHAWFKPGAPPVVLGAGRLTPSKDFPTLMRAFARLRRERDARLVIIGGAKTPKKTVKRHAELMALATELGFAGDVSLPGMVANPFAYMARAGVLAVSSRHEGFCNVLAEALACGCPCVATDCPSGPREILNDGRTGPLVPVGDHQALARAMRHVLDNPPAPGLLKSAAERFSVARAVDTYESLMVGPDRPAWSAAA
jgi:glycosyltransferase involved in cell wall biosynthesis